MTTFVEKRSSKKIRWTDEYCQNRGAAIITEYHMISKLIARIIIIMKIERSKNVQKMKQKVKEIKKKKCLGPERGPVGIYRLNLLQNKINSLSLVFNFGVNFLFIISESTP